MPIRASAPWGMLALVVLVACGGDDGGTGGDETGTASASASASVSASAEDGPEPMACIDGGGMCSCDGACPPGTAPSIDLSCPQPPDESGACSQQCCVAMPGSSGTDSGGSTGAVDSSGSDTAGGCVGAGEPCGAADLCSTWICVCNAGATEFMTVGSCEAGTCSTDGNAVCEAICTPSGGVAMATDVGCG